MSNLIDQCTSIQIYLNQLQNLTRTAFNYLNDSYKTNLCLHLPFQMIVACCIYLAFRHTQVEMPKIAWWTIMETSLQNLKMGAGKINNLYNQFKQVPKFKDCFDIINELAQKKNITLPFNTTYHELQEKQTLSIPMSAVAEAILKSKMKGQNQIGVNSSAERIQSSEQLDKNVENSEANGVSSLRDITRDNKHSKFSQAGRSHSKSKDRRKKSRSNSRKKTYKRKQSRSNSKSRDRNNDRNNDRNKDRKDKDKKHYSRRSKSRERRTSRERRSKSKDRRSRSKDRRSRSKDRHRRDRSRSQKDKRRRSKSRDRKRKDKSDSRQKTTISSKNEGKIDKFSSQVNSERDILTSKFQDNNTQPINENVENSSTADIINDSSNNKVMSITPEQGKQIDRHSPANQKKSRRERDISSSKVKEGKDKKDRKKSKSRSRSHHKKSKKYHNSPNDRDNKRKRSKDRKKDYRRSRSNSGERSSKFSLQTNNRFDKRTPSPSHKGDKFSSMVTENSKDFSSVQVRGPSSDSKQKNSELFNGLSSNGLLQEKDKEEEKKLQLISQQDKFLPIPNLNDLQQRIEQIKNASKPIQQDTQRKFDFLQKLKNEIAKPKVEEQNSTSKIGTQKPTLDINSKIADKLKQYKPELNKNNSQKQQNVTSSDDDKKQIDNDDSKSDSQENENELLMKLRKKRNDYLMKNILSHETQIILSKNR